jgi:transcriptional regulator with XRE-family HTH domain
VPVARRPPLAKLIGKRIVTLRTEAAITQEALGWDIGLTSKGYLSRIESGQRMPSLEFLERVAVRLGVEVRDLLTFPELGGLDAAIEDLRRTSRKSRR